MQNRRRKRLSSSPCRVVKRARSMDRAEMRPFIKQIEELKAENYQLQQKLELQQKTPEKSPVPPQTAENLETLKSQVREFQIQFHHQSAEIAALRAERDAVIAQLSIANSEIASSASTNEALETQLVHVTQNAGAVEYAKNMLSESLQAMITDYQNLAKDFGENRARHAREIVALKDELRGMEKSCKEGALKIAQTAKIELKKAHEEKFRVQKLLEEIMETKTETPLCFAAKCAICLRVKKVSDFSVSDPCGHIHCKTCTEKLTKIKSCPSCRGPVGSMVKIFA